MKSKAKRQAKMTEVKNAVKKMASVDTLLDVLPLIAPVPTAWAIGVALQEKLHWNTPIVAIAAAGIEAAGFVSADTASKYYEFNRTAEKGEQKAPAFLAYGAMILYIGGTLTMTFMYEPMAAVFPILSAVAFIEFVLRKDHQARISQRQADRATAKAEVERVKAERKAEREQKKLAKSQAEPATAGPEPAKPALFCTVAGCDPEKAKPFGSQSALNAHQRKHKVVAYAVSTITPVTKDSTIK